MSVFLFGFSTPLTGLLYGTFGHYFFFARNVKVCEKPIFCHIFVFFSGKNDVSRPFFSAFLAFFSLTFWFLAYFFDFFLGLKIPFLGHNSDNLLGLNSSFSRAFFDFIFVSIKHTFFTLAKL